MQLTGKSVMGIVFLLMGAAILLRMVFVHLAFLISLVLAAGLIIAGINQLVKGRKMWGWGILLFGLLAVLGAAHLVFQLLLAFIIILLGIKWLAPKNV
ncbi:hypothetical protein PU629_01315 [Pullulanibacillus sp. KACC 23026]|uniref:hypothetical protein n=1 Tax=Pullulanibacillus sp. KACC 23026 TaxID=3028315 RepID=UPI0023AEE651|nr:hypothetical protein [Pullulanibacillus sp. KACC 23026]WEG13026.1 hypothetical protein PU629_01315 [Pullulanibacillus sp. KACC 23026]